MPTNKQATIRYHALDDCFANPGRRFDINALIEACNQAIEEHTGRADGVKRRQVYSDITFMESDAGWSIPLERYKDGRRTFFRYTDPSFSIRGRGVNQAEVEQIAATLAILARYQGLPQFEWLEEIQVRIQDAFNTNASADPVVSFQYNPHLHGLRYFQPLFNAITRKQALAITYQSFQEAAPTEFTFHAWHLKQFNNRWFALGQKQGTLGLTTLALDRIQTLDSVEEEYQPNTSIDFADYFDDIIGVSFLQDATLTTIQLKAAADLWPYINSKPIHPSQKVLDRHPSGEVSFQLKLFPNYELTAVLLSFGPRIEVLVPESLRNHVAKLYQQGYHLYQ
ncbi:YafY family protein [Lewinella sp. 4G2]|uniref:helix-turn-helix transcriptional regulator n=1 Tax=Lewinella sp. 4G2 TaxID=1803372 RepID=UPI0007B4C9FF|nr:WYL domain-containing protein [Lewinella sp. 4G2]OAV43955.1 WYL domain-containing protein [Lewinella sp. 4G2]